MPKLLMSNSQKGWPFIQRLLVDLFKFMEPYLRNAELGEPVCRSWSSSYLIIEDSFFLFIVTATSYFCRLCADSLSLQRHSQSTAGSASWFSWVPMWLPFQLLRCDPSYLYSDAKCYSKCISTQYEASWSFYSKLKGECILFCFQQI